MSAYKNILKYFQEMKPFINEDYIPEIPIVDDESYNNIIIPNLIRCGAIPKKDLIIGREYLGSCRNANKAVWNGQQFEYIRSKYGYTYMETINHFEDDDSFDLFVPIKMLD